DSNRARHGRRPQVDRWRGRTWNRAARGLHVAHADPPREHGAGGKERTGTVTGVTSRRTIDHLNRAAKLAGGSHKIVIREQFRVFRAHFSSIVPTGSGGSLMRMRVLPALAVAGLALVTATCGRRSPVSPS